VSVELHLSVEKISSRLEQLEKRKNKLKEILDIIDGVVEDDYKNAEVISGLLTHDIDEEEVEREYLDLLDDINGLNDIIETTKTGKSLDSTQESFLRCEFTRKIGE
jgi:hypothetical protein